MNMAPVNQDMRSPNWESIRSQISQIRKAFGTPSITCGVLHHGERIFHHAEGFADVHAKRVPDVDTVYPIASCSKAFTSATCAILVDEGLLSWDEPVSSYLPEFKTVHNKEVSQTATLIDLCSHSTGLASMDHAILGFHDEYLNDGADQVKISSHLPMVSDFRTAFVYNNFMYGVVGEVISRVCNKSLGSVMEEKLFEPLGLSRTYTKAADYPSDGNVAKGYSVLDDGSFLQVSDPAIGDKSAQAGAGLIRSTVNDMLSWAKAVMQAEEHQSSREFAVKGELLPGMAFTRSRHIPVTTDSTTGVNSYGLGWFRHTIPSRWLGSISSNFMLLPDPPVIGQDSRERLTVCHYGALGGFLSAFYTFPETCSAIIVLANSSPSRGDPTDLIAQSLCQELFDMRPRVPLEKFALRAAETSRLIWPTLVHDWVFSRANWAEIDMMPVLADYVGTYRNEGLKLHIDVFESRQSKRKAMNCHQRNLEPLSFVVNSRDQQAAKLRYYQQDVWTFLPNSRDDASKKGMETYMSLPLVLLSFVRDMAGQIRWLDWDLYGVSGQSESHEAYKVEPVRFEKIR
ncbi:beta-lactamase/transpeptidase-like protein [Hypoxylon crocopeplum]|nr:beta-lactamase/transpeptidase-like protein [Hypoxylon crocopeplum]